MVKGCGDASSTYHISLNIQFESWDLGRPAELTTLVATPRVEAALDTQSDRVFFTTRNLYDLFIYVRYFDRQTLSQVVPMAQLADLAGSPSEYLAIVAQSTSVGVTTRDFFDCDTI